MSISDGSPPPADLSGFGADQGALNEVLNEADSSNANPAGEGAQPVAPIAAMEASPMTAPAPLASATDAVATPARKPVRRPNWTFLFSHPAHWFALGFGSGLPWVAPGTFGTLFGWAMFLVCAPYLNDVQHAVGLLLAFATGVWACGVTGRNLGVSDHGSIVWDEIVAIWLVLWLVPRTPVDQAIAFAVFRVIDITKPQPIRHFDAKWKNGFGVMFDDLLAAFFTLLIFAVYYRFAGLPV